MKTALCAAAIALLSTSVLAWPASAATIVYTLTADNPSIGGMLDLSFTSTDFLVLPTGFDTLTIPNVTTCIVESAPCVGSPFIASIQPIMDPVVVTLSSSGGGVSSGFARADFGAVGTYSSLVTQFVTMTVAAVPEPSTWAMMALGFGLMGLLGYRKTRSALA
jgi:PEP-CTERM motif